MAQGKGTRADGGLRRPRKAFHKFIKVDKRRTERRKARQNPECVPLYGRYDGYES